ncbi:MAG: hypothetical protein JNK82_30635 [Myxococcaceae bacterium]|nr:hypothetical protein [Myxococcaceae bacterium]
MVRRTVSMLLLLGAACDTPWKPPTVIEGLRVIGVRAEPPEVKPGETSSLEALVLDPTRPGEATTMVWLACEPDPYGAGRGACNDLASIGDQNALIDSMNLPEGVKLIGLGNRASFSTPANLFDVLEPGDDRRLKGTVATIASLAVGADVPLTAPPQELQKVLEKVQSKEISSVLTLFRVRVSENAPANVNPVIDEFVIDGEKLPRGATVMIHPYVDHVLDLEAHDAEVFDEILPTGEVEQREERLVASWYSNVGRFNPDRAALGSDVKVKFTGPGDLRNNDEVPMNRRGTFWGVLRDSRGGQVWSSWPFFICDLNRPWPRVTQVEHTGTQVILRGENLDQILDVVSNGAAVPGAFSASQGTWSGNDAPEPLELRTRGCGRVAVAQ